MILNGPSPPRMSVHLEEHFPLEVKVREADWETFVVHVRLA